jgi:hypothetical protein
MSDMYTMLDALAEIRSNTGHRGGASDMIER